MNMGRRLVVGSAAALLFGSQRVFAQTPAQAPAPGLRSIAVLQIELLDDQNNPAPRRPAFARRCCNFVRSCGRASSTGLLTQVPPSHYRTSCAPSRSSSIAATTSPRRLDNNSASISS
jgi:hypothetical protein